MDPTHGPIVEEQREMMNVIAQTLDRLFNGEATGDDRKVCFTVLVTNFGDIKDGRVNYISNGEREHVVTMMKELIGRFEK